MENVIGWLILKTKIDTNDIKKELDNFKKNAPKKILGALQSIGKSIVSFFTGIAKTITSILGPALFLALLTGIGLVVNAVKDITKEIKINDVEQISAQVQYIGNAIKGMVLPVVQAVASVIKRILDYVIYIGEAWFGLSKFAGNYKKEVKNAGKETKKLNKELAKFDEVNVLNEQKGGGGGSMEIPEYKGMDGEPPKWLQWIVESKDKVIGALKEIYDAVTKWGKPIADGFKQLFGSIWNDAIKPAIDIAIQVWNGFVQVMLELWNEYGQPLLDNIRNFVTSTIELFQSIWDNIIEPIITPFLEMLSWLWEKHLKGLVKEVGAFILTLVNGALEIYNEFIEPIVKALLEQLGPAFAFLGNLIVGSLGTALGVIVDVAKAILKVFRGIIDFIVGVFTGKWEKAWNGIKNIFTGVWDGITGIFKGIINLVIDVINSFVAAINKISFDVPDWVPVIGGKKWGFNIPKIPKLATGGIVDVPRTGVRVGNAIAGEKGAEGVLPFENADVMQRVGQEIAKWIPINLNITNELDGRILSNRLETIRQNNSFSRNGG